MGKSSPAPPPAPDLIGAARETAAGDLEAARFATKANRINQYTPYGSLTYSQTGDDPDAGWSQTQTLNPVAQDTLDRQMELSNRFAGIAGTGLDKVQTILENPQLDLSQLPQRAINVGQTAQDAIMSRLNPQFAASDEALRARLANQGITLGSDAYTKEMQLSGNARNDALMQAALQGISLDQANRGAALQEQAYLQDRPLNLVNALRTGAQVQNPTFQQFANQATTRGADVLGATQGQYKNQLDSYNADQASNEGGLFGLLGTIAGSAAGPMGASGRGLFS